MPKFLIVRFSSIGDIVLTSPVVRCIKEQVKDSEIHFLTKKNFETIVSPNPHVTKVYCIEKKTGEILAQLKKEKYDYIIDLHNNLRSAQLKFGLGKTSFTFKKLNFQKFLLVNFKKEVMPKVHIVDRYLQTVSELGVKNDGKGLEFYIQKENEVHINSLPITHQKGYTGIVIGAAHFTKRLPTHKIMEVCKQLNSPVVLLGGKEDAETAKQIATAIGSNAYNACGTYNLQQSASLVKQAQAILTNDTGLMHIAAAFKKKIVSVWGNTVPEFGMYPYLTGYGENGGGKRLEIKGLSCRPCSKIGFEKCPKGHFNCMNQLEATSIAEALLI